MAGMLQYHDRDPMDPDWERAIEEAVRLWTGGTSGRQMPTPARSDIDQRLAPAELGAGMGFDPVSNQRSRGGWQPERSTYPQTPGTVTGAAETPSFRRVADASGGAGAMPTDTLRPSERAYRPDEDKPVDTGVYQDFPSWTLTPGLDPSERLLRPHRRDALNFSGSLDDPSLAGYSAGQVGDVRRNGAASRGAERGRNFGTPQQAGGGPSAASQFFSGQDVPLRDGTSYPGFGSGIARVLEALSPAQRSTRITAGFHPAGTVDRPGWSGSPPGFGQPGPAQQAPRAAASPQNFREAAALQASSKGGSLFGGSPAQVAQRAMGVTPPGGVGHSSQLQRAVGPSGGPLPGTSRMRRRSEDFAHPYERSLARQYAGDEDDLMQIADVLTRKPGQPEYNISTVTPEEMQKLQPMQANPVTFTGPVAEPLTRRQQRRAGTNLRSGGRAVQTGGGLRARRAARQAERDKEATNRVFSGVGRRFRDRVRSGGNDGGDGGSSGSGRSSNRERRQSNRERRRSNRQRDRASGSGRRS